MSVPKLVTHNKCQCNARAARTSDPLVTPLLRRLPIIIISIGIVSLGAVQAGPSTHSLNEDAALNLLLRTLKHDHVYAKRISLDCVTFGTEETTGAYFEFVLRENHTVKCGGDPEVSPAVDRYRVYRASGKLNGWTGSKITGSVTTRRRSANSLRLSQLQLFSVSAFLLAMDAKHATLGSVS